LFIQRKLEKVANPVKRIGLWVAANQFAGSSGREGVGSCGAFKFGHFFFRNVELAKVHAAAHISAVNPCVRGEKFFLIGVGA
jgi:hypothetical protein